MKIHHFERSQIVPITLDEAWEFFSNPLNLDELTPDDIVEMQFASDGDSTPAWSVANERRPSSEWRFHHDILAAVQAQQAVYGALHDEAMALIRATIHTHGSAA